MVSVKYLFLEANKLSLGIEVLYLISFSFLKRQIYSVLWSDHPQKVKVFSREWKKKDFTHILSQLWQLDRMLKHKNF